MSEVSNVTAAKPATGGAVYVADVGATLPTDVSTALGTDFTCLGYISEDGLTGGDALSTDVIKAWGGDEVLVTNSGKETTYSFTLIEALNVDVLKYVYGDDNVSGTLSTGIVINVNSDDLPDKAMVIDMVMKDGTLKRICMPQTAITEVGEVTYSDSGAVGYQITVRALPDSSDTKKYEYIQSATE